jgi:hypothetical protein
MATIEIKIADSQGGGSYFVTIDPSKTYTSTVSSDFDVIDVLQKTGATEDGRYIISLLNGDGQSLKNGAELAASSAVTPGDEEDARSLMNASWARAMEEALSSGSAVLSIRGYYASDNDKVQFEVCSKEKKEAEAKLTDEYFTRKDACSDDPSCTAFRFPWGGIVTLVEADNFPSGVIESLAAANGNERNSGPCSDPALNNLTFVSNVTFEQS